MRLSLRAFSHNKRPPIHSLLRLIIPQFAKYRVRLLLGFLALLCVDFLQLTIPGYLQQGVDSLAQGTATSYTLAQVGGYILVTAASIVGLRFCWRSLIIGFSRLLEQHLRERLMRHVLQMDRPFFDSHTTGDIMAHATNDLSSVQMATGMGMVAAADAVVMSLAALFFMARISPTLTMIAIIPMPLLAICARVLSGRLHKQFDQVQGQFSLLTEFARNTMVSIRLIKGYTRERRQREEFDLLGQAYLQANIKVAVIQGLLFPVATLVGNTGMLLILYFGGKFVISGEISLGDFVAFVTYMFMLIWPMMAVGWVTNLAQRGLTSLGRIHKLLSTCPLLAEPDASVNEPEIIELSFACSGLDFVYPGSKQPALQNIDLTLRPGILGIAGSTGSGKSTLCRVLTRQYPVERGMLYFSGSDVNDFSLDTLRGQISYVSQQPVLFSGTIAENICLAKPDASKKEIVRVARLAAIDAEISKMTNQYETIVGERGIRLSGGQKQRISIARALLADRPVLIIDDALSALDVETEQQVFSGIKSCHKGKIVLIVSHRLKLLSVTGQVIVMDQGKIIDQGNHQQLLARNVLYQTMAAKQQRREDA